MNGLKNSNFVTMSVGQLKSSVNSFNMPYLVQFLKLDNSEGKSIFDISRQNLKSVFKNTHYRPRDSEMTEKLNSIIKVIILVTLIIRSPENDTENKLLQEKIANWFRLPNPYYGMNSPFDMIMNNRGKEVLESLTDILESTPS